jgi:hypothetical protein
MPPHCWSISKFRVAMRSVRARRTNRAGDGDRSADLVATLTMAAAGPGSKTLSGGPRDLSPEAAREIREMGFEQYIRSHVDNDGMAYNP